MRTRTRALRRIVELVALLIVVALYVIVVTRGHPGGWLR
jgi:hypothetical protein